MTSFLDLTNKVLIKLNELPLTSSTFGSATGFHAVAKEAVNNSIRAINRESYEWPFNHATTTDNLVNDQVEYDFPTNAKVLDFDTFTLAYDQDGTTHYKTLQLIDYDTYIKWHFVQDKNLIGTTDGRVPDYVFRHGDKYGVTPVPYGTMSVTYNSFSWPDTLVNYNDSCSISSRYDDVIVFGAMAECYDFRTMNTQANKADLMFKEGIKQMRTHLLNDYQYVRDTRISRDLG